MGKMNVGTVRFPAVATILLFSVLPTTIYGPTDLFVKWKPGSLFTEVEQTQRQSDHSFLSLDYDGT
jgi:hypothetical protein